MTPRRQTASARILALLMVALLAVALAACGSDDDKESGGGDTEAVEKAFLTGMTHHHGTAIEMSEIAKERSQSTFVTGLADDIISTQERELEEMKEIYGRLIGGELEPDPGAHDGLGLSAEESGMTHTADTNEMLETAKPFDRAFVDEMVPHHTGAVKMAEVVLKSTEDDALRTLAEGIISTQEREIAEMNSFRTEEYGGPVPASGGGGSGGEEHGDGHSG